MSGRSGPRPIEIVAGLTPIAFVLGLLALLFTNRHEEPNAFAVPSAVAFLAPMAAACAIALIGVARRSGPLQLVAGTLLALCSVLAFSGVALVLLIPAVLLLYLGAKGNGSERPPASRGTKRARWLRVVVGAAASAPLVVLVTAQVGILVFVAGLAIPLAALGMRRTVSSGRHAPRVRDLTLAASIAALAIAGAFVLFTRTQQLCWERIETPAGPIESLGPGEPTRTRLITGNELGGCGPVTTPAGFGLGLGLLLASVVLAWNAAPMIRSDGRPAEPPRPEQ
jgi:hypothetical protein